MFITLQEFYVDIYQKHNILGKYITQSPAKQECIYFMEFLLPQFISAKQRVVEYWS